MSPHRTALDTAGAANYLGVSERHIRALRHRRAIPCFKVGGSLRFWADELDAWTAVNRGDGPVGLDAAQEAAVRRGLDARAAQGLPPYVTDTAILDAIRAAIVANQDTRMAATGRVHAEPAR